MLSLRPMFPALFRCEIEAGDGNEAKKDNVGNQDGHSFLHRSTAIPDASSAAGKITITPIDLTVNV